MLYTFFRLLSGPKSFSSGAHVARIIDLTLSTAHIAAAPPHILKQYYGFGVVHVKSDIEERAIELAEYIIENKATVRAAAKKFGVSKSTVHKDLTERLERINRTLYLQAKEILETNKAERHIRGGIATRMKYKGADVSRTKQPQ